MIDNLSDILNLEGAVGNVVTLPQGQRFNLDLSFLHHYHMMCKVLTDKLPA